MCACRLEQRLSNTVGVSFFTLTQGRVCDRLCIVSLFACCFVVSFTHDDELEAFVQLLCMKITRIIRCLTCVCFVFVFVFGVMFLLGVTDFACAASLSYGAA